MKLAIRSNRFFSVMKPESIKISRVWSNKSVLCRLVIMQWRSWSHDKTCFSNGEHSPTHPRRPRSSQSGWGKARRKFSSTSGRTPGYRLSADHFQAVKQMLAPDWAQKMLCIIVPNRRRVSPEFFSWVRTRRLLSLQTYRFVHQACSCKGNFHFLLS